MNLSVRFQGSESINKIGKAVYAGNLKATERQAKTRSAIEEKRAFAGKQAMKLIGDAWDKDQKRTDSIKGLDDLKSSKVEELIELRNRKAGLEEEKAKLQKQYGVDADSQEQKDLELLQKYQNNRNGVSYDSFSEEELKRLGELQNMERTEYQSKVLQINDYANTDTIAEEKLKAEIKELSASISEEKSAQLKSRDMEKAVNAAEQLMENTGKEVLGMLIEDGTAAQDEKLEETVEKAKEQAEKKAEEDEKLQEKKEERKEQQELLENIAKADKLNTEVQTVQTKDTTIKEAQKEVEKILKDNNLINEDIKGFNIDLGF